ncbi:biotin-dependent carboxyltransferase family protein [Ruicaihuangia caeni]|uniref:Biotin-dependent carboxyltransferase family protein n=1 Tax=Ruicaihuangia caeni TaxID=3042517 RepID=A0AAW6TDE8_9MICO|nr:biotin-dependent carboxyltransferase family protein [Klugiella sp. YN-L-19]MDI2099092.1 biotin-dependent carboxyltransferase family protein [Klugiella sp. YN-L-19]
MTTQGIEVLDAGILTHIQDGGRVGQLPQGIAPSGAQDYFSLRLANLLVGNAPTPAPLSSKDPGPAGLELTAKGPTLRFDTDAIVAVTGAPAEITLNGRRRPHNASFLVSAGDVLAIGAITGGMRSYLAVQGGIRNEPYIGSRSTHLFAQFGGIGGRALQAGDQLPLADEPLRYESVGSIVGEEAARYSLENHVLHVTAGPQDHLFTEESIDAFFGEPWTLGALNSRMGFRFAGPKLSFLPRPNYVAEAAGTDPSNIVDDIIPIGGIQCPSGSEAIVMGVENPTVGGFAKIATVISADLGRVGQLSPGDTVRFERVSTEQALELLAWQLHGDHIVQPQSAVA